MFLLVLAVGLPAKAAETPAFPLPPNGGAVPQVVCEPSVHHFGRVPAGRTVLHEFRITNSGNNLLKIIHVEPTCGCIQIGNWDRSVPPGGTGHVALRLDTSGLSGEIRRSILVKTNAPSRRTLSLWMEGRIESGWTADPAQVAFGVLDPEQRPWRRKVRISNWQGGTQGLVPPENRHPAFSLGWKEVNPGRMYELTVEANDGLAPGAYAGEIRIRPRAPGGEPLSVLASAYVPDPVWVRPARIILKTGPQPVGFERIVQVRNLRPRKMKIDQAVVTAPGCTARIEKVRNGKEYRIILKIPEGFVLPSGGAELRIRTNDPEKNRLVVPLLPDLDADIPEALQEDVRG